MKKTAICGCQLHKQNAADTVTHMLASMCFEGQPFHQAVTDVAAVGVKSECTPRIHNMAVALDGIIYNKSALCATYGMSASVSDEELVAAMYRQEKENFLEKLDGAFTLALFDTERRVWLLAVDRFAQRPLFYSVQDGELLFASELKAMMALPFFRKELDREALALYLEHGYVPAPKAIFRDVYKLRGGSCFLFTSGKAKVIRYWTPQKEYKRVKRFDGSYEQAKQALTDSLDRAVKTCLAETDSCGTFFERRD